MGWFKFLIIIIVVLYLLGGLGLYIFQEKIIFLPEPLDQDFEYQFESSFDELNFEMEDGAVINGLHSKMETAKGIIVYFHGNADNLSRWGLVVEPFLEYGYEVLVVDYRGYGKSTGKRTKKSMITDAEQVYAWATEKWSQDEIILYGRSLGSSFASYLAGKYSPKQVILEAPFHSIGDMARRLAWMYPTKGILRYNFNNEQSLRAAKCPITIIHGTDDGIVPLSSGKKLHEAIKSSKLIEIEKGEHNDLARFEEYWAEINRLLK